jgi:hypothetical protein
MAEVTAMSCYFGKIAFEGDSAEGRKRPVYIVACDVRGRPAYEIAYLIITHSSPLDS